jgi:hypothetical protein
LPNVPVKHPKISKMRTLKSTYSSLRRKKNLVVMQPATRWFHFNLIPCNFRNWTWALVLVYWVVLCVDYISGSFIYGLLIVIYFGAYLSKPMES